jgi:hypothetical protein
VVAAIDGEDTIVRLEFAYDRADPDLFLRTLLVLKDAVPVNTVYAYAHGHVDLGTGPQGLSQGLWDALVFQSWKSTSSKSQGEHFWDCWARSVTDGTLEPTLEPAPGVSLSPQFTLLRDSVLRAELRLVLHLA